MRPVHRALGVVAVVLVLLALAGITATATGWVPLGPDPLPITAYAVHPDVPHDINATLDHGTFDVHGSTYAAELAGIAAPSNGGTYAVVIHHTAGTGGRIVFGSLNLSDAASGLHALGGPAYTDDGTLTWTASLPFSPGNHTIHAEAIILTYRDTWIGAWSGAPIVLRFEANVTAEAPT